MRRAALIFGQSLTVRAAASCFLTISAPASEASVSAATRRVTRSIKISSGTSSHSPRKSAPQIKSLPLAELNTRLQEIFAHASADKREKLAKTLSEHFRDAAAQAKTKAAAPKPKKAAPRSKPV